MGLGRDTRELTPTLSSQSGHVSTQEDGSYLQTKKSQKETTLLAPYLGLPSLQNFEK